MHLASWYENGKRYVLSGETLTEYAICQCENEVIVSKSQLMALCRACGRILLYRAESGKWEELCATKKCAPFPVIVRHAHCQSKDDIAERVRHLRATGQSSGTLADISGI